MKSKRKAKRREARRDSKKEKNDFKWHITIVDAIKYDYCTINTYISISISTHTHTKEANPNKTKQTSATILMVYAVFTV